MLRRLNDGGQARHGNAVIVIPSDPDYAVTVEFAYQSREGTVS